MIPERYTYLMESRLAPGGKGLETQKLPLLQRMEARGGLRIGAGRWGPEGRRPAAKSSGFPLSVAGPAPAGWWLCGWSAVGLSKG